MTQGLHTYLHDHIAGAEAAVNVISFLSEHTDNPVLARSLTDLLHEVKEDKATLEAVAKSLGTSPSHLKNTAAWIGARVVDLKTRAGMSSFGAFEGLEFIALGIQGKLHLWRALQHSKACAVAAFKPDYVLLIRRAESQHSRAESLRLEFAKLAL